MKAFQPDRLRILRKSKGYSLQVMARLLGLRMDRKLSRSAISHWERGVSCPSLESLVALSDLFDVPLDYFFVEQTNSLFAGKKKKPLQEKHGPRPKPATRSESDPAPEGR